MFPRAHLGLFLVAMQFSIAFQKSFIFSSIEEHMLCSPFKMIIASFVDECWEIFGLLLLAYLVITTMVIES